MSEEVGGGRLLASELLLSYLAARCLSANELAVMHELLVQQVHEFAQADGLQHGRAQREAVEAEKALDQLCSLASMFLPYAQRMPPAPADE